jgi:dTDP-4-dehydrorhamnose reductase
MKIMILGSTGMIGHKIHQVLSRNKAISLFNISKSQLNDETIILDLQHLDELQHAIQNIKPDVVVNAAGILIEESELSPLESVYLNAVLPLTLSDLSKELGFKLIQISTDCVFSGKSGPYSVYDIRDADSIYGRTKALGEVYEMSNLTIRTSVIGPDLRSDGKELFNWFMNQSGEVNGFCRSMWSGVTTLELAKCVEYCIFNEITGFKHLTSGTTISKYDLLKEMNQQSGKELVVKRVDGPISNKVLLAEDSFFYSEPQSYSVLVKNMISDICESTIYPHYEFHNI